MMKEVEDGSAEERRRRSVFKVFSGRIIHKRISLISE